MRPTEFLSNLEEMLGGKPLTPFQMNSYLDRIRDYTDKQRQQLYEQLLSTCTRFPKIADIALAADELGFNIANREFHPHTWTETDCPKCAGSGRMAAFYSQEFEKTENAVFEVRKLQLIEPYEGSTKTNKTFGVSSGIGGHRYIFRCDCPAGDAPTIEKGIPRWSTETPLVSRRPW